MSKLSISSWLLISLGLLNAPQAFSQVIPVHAEGLSEELVSVRLDANRRQEGVLSVKSGTQSPIRLAVLLPGSPSVVRAVVENGVMQSSKLTGNFLIRARRFLANGAIATLIVDCQSDSGSTCSSGYQASKERQEDVNKLIDEVKRKWPSLREVWLVGTSMGTISSSFMPIYGRAFYSGAIHTATITEPFAKNSYRELGEFEYARAQIPQFFIHHKDDPCSLTTFAGAVKIAEKYKVPLVQVSGGGGFSGAACEANTEHGFKGKEKVVMETIAEIIVTGKVSVLSVQ